jgi:hypothetical protein
MLILSAVALMSCSTAYRAQPMPFKAPEAYKNSVVVEQVVVGGMAFVDPVLAKEAFGFDVRGAGMLPVQLVFDNQGADALNINPGQTFLEDDEGNLWPILTDSFAYERASKYAQTNQIFKEGAYNGFLGAAAGGLIGAAIGIVSGENVAAAAGKGAAVGAAAGATIGGASAYATGDARAEVIKDLRAKSLENKSIAPQNLSHGIIFFPGEAKSAKQLRLQLQNAVTGQVHTVLIKFPPVSVSRPPEF